VHLPRPRKRDNLCRAKRSPHVAAEQPRLRSLESSLTVNFRIDRVTSFVCVSLQALRTATAPRSRNKIYSDLPRVAQCLQRRSAVNKRLSIEPEPAPFSRLLRPDARRSSPGKFLFRVRIKHARRRSEQSSICIRGRVLKHLGISE